MISSQAGWFLFLDEIVPHLMLVGFRISGFYKSTLDREKTVATLLDFLYGQEFPPFKNWFARTMQSADFR
jgi:hypothetical protein